MTSSNVKPVDGGKACYGEFALVPGNRHSCWQRGQTGQSKASSAVPALASASFSGSSRVR
jgi:hypothetical protein